MEFEERSDDGKVDVQIKKNKLIIDFFDKYGISKKLSKKIMETQTSFFSVSTSGLFNPNKETEFIKKRKLQLIQDKYEKIKQKENISERNQEINNLLKETKELEDGSIQNSDEFKKLLEDKRELFLNDSVYSEALNNELENISNLLKFNRDEGIKKIELMEKEGKLNDMKKREIYEKAGLSYSATKTGAKKEEVITTIYTDYEKNKKKMVDAGFTDSEILLIDKVLRENPELYFNNNEDEDKKKKNINRQVW